MSEFGLEPVGFLIHLAPKLLFFSVVIVIKKAIPCSVSKRILSFLNAVQHRKLHSMIACRNDYHHL